MASKTKFECSLLVSLLSLLSLLLHRFLAFLHSHHGPSSSFTFPFYILSGGFSGLQLQIPLFVMAKTVLRCGVGVL